MTRKALRVFLAAGALLAVMWHPAQAQGELRVVDTSVAASFPMQLGFSMSAASGVDIVDVRLHYRVLRTGFADVISEAYIPVAPARSVEADWQWDMRRTGGLPPGAVVEYWWTVRDAEGEEVETIPRRFQFDDDRFSWRTLAEGKVSLHWYEGERSFAEDIMAAVQGSLARLSADTGAHLTEPIDLFIYGSPEDLRSALLFPQEWTGGVAFTRYGRIAIGIGPSNIGWGRRAITHELTHLVVHQMTLNPYGGLPTWLEEGLAMRSEGPLETRFELSLSSAARADALITAKSLSSPFSTSAQQSVLSYAESYSLVDFLVTAYGSDKMLELLETFREGATYDGALLSVYGFDTAGLHSRWLDDLQASMSSGGTPVDGVLSVAVLNAAAD